MPFLKYHSLDEFITVDPDAVVEEIDLAAFSGQQTFDVTAINGIVIRENFPVVFYHFRNVLTIGGGTGIGFDFQLRDQATETWRTSNYISYDRGVRPQNENTTRMNIASGTAIGGVAGYIYNITTNAPTVHEGFDGEGSNTAHYYSIYDDPEPHDAIRWRVHSAGDSANWFSGTLYLMGYRYPPSKVNVQTVSMDNLPNFQFQPPNNKPCWASLVMHNYQRDAAVGRPQLRMGVDGLDNLAGDYFHGQFSDFGSSQGDTSTFINVGTDNHDEDATSVMKIMNLNVNAPCSVRGHMFEPVPNGSIYYMGANINQNNINTIGVGNYDGGSDFAPGSGIAYFVTYEHRVNVVQHDLNGVSEWEASNIGPMVHYISTDYDTDSSAIISQHGDGAYVTSSYSINTVIANNTTGTDSGTGGDVSFAFTAAQGAQVAFGEVYGLDAIFDPLHRNIYSTDAGGFDITRSSWAFGNNVPVENDQYRHVRNAGTWEPGISVYEIEYIVRVA